MVVSRHKLVFQIYRETEEFQLCRDKYARGMDAIFGEIHRLSWEGIVII
jgi:hypothetical protein